MNDPDILIAVGFIALAIFLNIVKYKAKHEAERKKQAKKQPQTIHQPQVEEMEEARTRTERNRHRRRPQTFQELLAELTGQKVTPKQQKQAPKPTQVISDNYDEGAEHHVSLHKEKEKQTPSEWQGMKNLTEAQKLFVYSEIINPKFREE